MPNGRPDYIWLPALRRYRDRRTGRWASTKTVREWSATSIEIAADESRGLAGALNAGDVTLGDWEKSMRAQIKAEYIRQYLLGRGGRKEMTQRDWGSIGGMLKEQFSYLSGFSDAIAAETLSEKQIAARSAMYFRSAREAFERANGRAHAELSEVRWVTTSGAPCTGCMAFAAMGWQRRADDPYGGAVPGSGATPCLCITTPQSKVLTLEGWKPLIQVRVGELVFTHKARWQPVTGFVVKPSQPYHRQASLKLKGYNEVGCTHDHLWFTVDGWLPSTDIDNSNLLVYHLPRRCEDVETLLRGMWTTFAETEQANEMYRMPFNLPTLWREERFQGTRMCKVCGTETQPASQGTVGQSCYPVQDDGWLESRRRETTHEIRDFITSEMAGQRRQAALDLVLERRQEAHDLPIPMEMDCGKWPNSRRLCYPPQRFQSSKRRAGKSPIDDQFKAFETAWCQAQDRSKGEEANLDLRKLWKGVPALPQAFRESRPKVLFSGMLPQGTPIYDLTVKKDHSFIIEGLIAHNTNCLCELDYK